MIIDRMSLRWLHIWWKHWRGWCLLILTPGLLMDPLLFAYQPGIGVQDTVIFLPNIALSRLEKAGSLVRIMFFYFSSAFNTIQPAPGLHGGGPLSFYVYTGLPHKLTTVCEGLWLWVWLDCGNTGAPQETVLAPFFRFSSETCHLQNFFWRFCHRGLDYGWWWQVVQWTGPGFCGLVP